MTITEFKELGLSENIINALEKKGFTNPTPIQKKAIPILLEGNLDIIGQAQTGTGKTAAFGIPMIETLNEGSKNVQALVLTPTRELAIQVSDEINSLKGNKNLNIIPVYGGQPINEQIRKLKKGVDIVVGTPGRILDHLNRGTLNLHNVSYIVLDEADEMLDMGFIDDVEEILKYTNPDKKMLLFSATLPRKIMGLAKKHMRKYEVISVKKEQLITNMVEQFYYEVRSSDKFEALCRTIDMNNDFYGLVFCKTRADVNDITNKLANRGYKAEGIHGDIVQNQRERILSRFKNRRSNILVATDVAARGIDINNLTHVINYSLPQNPESYVHRIGRTGRAGKRGVAITFVQPDEIRKLKYIKKIAKTDIERRELPTVKDIISAKKSSIIDNISNSSKEYSEEYLDIAKKLLEENDAEKVVASLLKYIFQDELSEKRYGKIKQNRHVKEVKEGQSRLFVALGKKDGMNPRELVEYIENKSGVRGRYIDDVAVFENFSYITVSSRDAKKIIDTVGRIRRNGKSIVEYAKKRKNY
ncbi:DEAD/DEAH box helicase [Methanothermococcus sp.]|uniref:DEAD/DEAH box helicase n=1 Tax=Methanothermococcus sp. TaxID=2614238 RepID=UPI0025E79700|nr:DEAD/DEAH box helicase [Methanothermococcus sp.]